MFPFSRRKHTNFLKYIDSINSSVMDYKNSNINSILFYSLALLLILPVHGQSEGKMNGSLAATGIYLKNLHADWQPPGREFDLHSMDIREFRFGFSNVSFEHLQGIKKQVSKVKISGPDLSLKQLTIHSIIKSADWVTEEKIKRLKKRESIPKRSIEAIAGAIDLYMVDHNVLPASINDLSVKQYINMEDPPLNDYSWSYSLALPDQIIAQPTQINPVPKTKSIYFDWQSRSFQMDPVQDSLYQVPMVVWDYKFEIQEISHLFSSALDLELSPDQTEFDIMLNRGQFKISNITFTATPGSELDNQSRIHLPELNLETNGVVLNGNLNSQPIIHKGRGNFRIRNFEIKIPDGLREEPEIQSLLETLGIWNNALKVRLLELDLNLINEFTGDVGFKLHTPFLKVSITGDFTLRQTGSRPDVILHRTEVKIHPIALGVRKWIRDWEKKNGKMLNRQGATIVLRIEGSINDPMIQGF